MLKQLKYIPIAIGLWKLRWRRMLTAVGVTPAAATRQLPQDLWAGNPIQGKAILSGEFVFHGDPFTVNADSWRKIEHMDVAWQREFYGFSWLRHVVSYADEVAESARIRQYIQSIWRQKLNHQPVARHPDILGERVSNWITYRSFLLRNADAAFRRKYYKKLYNNLKRLEANRFRRGSRTSLTVLKGLILGSLTLPSAEFLYAPALATLKQALRLRILPDGGHFSRSPEWLLEEIRTLMEIRAFVDFRKAGSVQFLDDIISRMMTALATVTHTDGGLALFHDSLALPTREVTRLWQAWRKPQLQPLAYLPEMKFVRLQQAASVLIMDAGLPNPSLSRNYYSTLAFEFTSDEERIFVNCGAYRSLGIEWRRACKSTAAHNTLAIDNTNSWVRPDEARHTLVFQPEVSCKLEDTQENILTVDAAYNGYVPYAGMVHYRKLALSAEGRCLQGVDVLTPHKAVTSKDTHRIQIRFHLLPDTVIQRAVRGSIELKTAGGQLWRFTTPKEFPADVQDSVFLGMDGRPQKTQQLCIETILTGQRDLRIDWELRRLPM